MIVAPHPDDETLGCGGLIRLKRNLGADAHVVFLTRGEKSLNGYTLLFPEVVAAKRSKLAEKACRCLGVAPSFIYWLQLQDSAIPSPRVPGFEAAVSALAELMVRLSPEEILAPSPADAFPDHVNAREIATAALRRTGKPIKLIHYLVWGWHNAPWRMRQIQWDHAWRLDISSALSAKLAAIHCYLDLKEPTSRLPYVGKLPKCLISCAMKREEVFFDA